MSILLFLVFGLIVGLIARALLPGDQRLGWLATTALGVVGSLLGGLVSQMLFAGRIDEPVTAGWIGSIVGAMVVLAVGAKVLRGRLRHV